MAKKKPKPSSQPDEQLQSDDELYARWTSFSRKYSGHPALESDTLYALPIELVEQIEKVIPGFFRPEDIKFEENLSLAAGGGFCMQRPFGYLSLSQVPPTQADRKLDERARKSAEETREMILQELIGSDIPRKKAEAALKRETVSRKKLLERREGYAGWLVTNSTFRKERDTLRTAIKKTVQRDRRFPVFPHSILGESPHVPKRRREFFDNYVMFYRRWGLDRMETWDLPVPMWSEVDTPSFYDLNKTRNFDLNQIHEAGMMVFLPWYLLRFQDVRISDILKKKRVLSAPSSVRAWLNGAPEGTIRFSLMLRLYVYGELCLKRRYEQRLKNNVRKLDAAFAAVLHPSETTADKYVETVKRTRQKMSRRLADKGA